MFRQEKKYRSKPLTNWPIQMVSLMVDCMHLLKGYPSGDVLFAKLYFYIHTYIIGHFNISVRIIDLVSHTTT